VSGDDLELRIAWQRAIGGDRVDASEFERVVARYRESHRCYHTVRHLRWVVRHALTLHVAPPVVELDHDIDAVVVAAFFHDAIYDPTRSDNERRSAELATAHLDRIGWNAERIDHVTKMVVATGSHAVPAADLDTALLFAADLAVLAAEPNAYGDYVRNVRREYAHVDDAAWRSGRAAVLSSFLERARIFDARLRLGPWERRARANIASELAALQSV
jgi:predicted metal-dependent HD superfamily phosphohydrolase